MDARLNVRPIQILRLPEVCKTTGLGRSMVYQLEAEQRFPARVRISERAVGWVEEEIQGWLAERIQRAELDYLFSSVAAQTSLAENYVGLPFDD